MKDISILPKAEQRVIIAKDVIAQLKADKYIAVTGKYVDTSTIMLKEQEYVPDEFLEKDIQKTLKEVEECEVCALGACLLSITKYKNKLNRNDIGSGGTGSMNEKKIKGLFNSMFTPKQLLLIESAFEGYSDESDRVAKDLMGYEELTDKEIEAVEDFWDSYQNDADRLMAIMTNIVKNKGTFVI